jgi:arylsulfatase A-like enzyme
MLHCFDKTRPGRRRPTPVDRLRGVTTLTLGGCVAFITQFVMTPTINAQSSDRPNIILVMADDQGWGDMAYNGHPLVKTPHFDEAAATGLRFDRFYAAAPVCSPTRASVMTGRHPNRMGVFKWGYPMRPQETTIAEALKNAGYTTGHFGKWHLGSVRNASPAHPGRNGFDHWLSAPNFYDNDAVLSLQGKAVQTSGESSIVAAEAALDWIDETTRQDAPFLAVVWFGSPHGPHRAAERDRALYDGQPKNVQHFLGEITGMDRAFGKLRDGLTTRGLRDNTILWYCSDNGALPKVGSSGGHRGSKGDVYDGGLLVPAILEWPDKITQPRSSELRCSTCDIYPTLVEITGAQVQNQPPLDGTSLLPLITGKPLARPKAMGFWDYPAKGIGTPSAAWMAELLTAQQAGGDLPPHPSSVGAAVLPDPPYSTRQFPGHAAWIDGDWKLHRLEDKSGNVTWELYNLADDPSEETNRLDNETSVANRLKPDLQTWLASVARSLNGEDYD